MSSVSIHSRYSSPVHPGIVFTDVSLAHQEFLPETQTQNIINKYIRVGANPFLPVEVGQFLDCSSVADFQTSMNRFRSVSEYFDSLPSDIRLRFNNDSRLFAQFASVPDNKKELIDMGLLPKDIEPTPSQAKTSNSSQVVDSVEDSSVDAQS